MPDGAIETVTIAEAAALLGVHRNTVRNRIKAGRYKAHKLITAQGETYAIERESLGLVPHNGVANDSHAQVRHSSVNGSQPGALVDGTQQAQQVAVVQRLLAPFVEDLAKTHTELGRVQERLAVAEQERDELRAELDRLRAAADAPQDAPVAQPEAPGATEPPRPGEASPVAWRRPPPIEETPIARWRRWWRRVVDG